MPKSKVAVPENEIPAQPAAIENQSEPPSEAVGLPFDSAKTQANSLAWLDDKPTSQRESETISLRYAYQGRPSKGRMIAAGDYAQDDARLFGLAEYLIKTGHAEVVKNA